MSGRGLVETSRPGSGRGGGPHGGLAVSQSGCGRGRSWLCSSLKMAAQSPSGIRLSAVSSREGRSGPGPRRAGGRASERDGCGRRRLEGPAGRPGGRGADREPPPCRSARTSGREAIGARRAAPPSAAGGLPSSGSAAAASCCRSRALPRPPVHPPRSGAAAVAEPSGLAGGGRGCRADAVPARVRLSAPSRASQSIFARPACPCHCFWPRPVVTNPSEAVGSGHTKRLILSGPKHCGRGFFT